MSGTQSEAEYLKGKLVNKRDDLQCEIVAFSEYGRFPSTDDFKKIGSISVELAKIEHTLEMIAIIE